MNHDQHQYHLPNCSFLSYLPGKASPITVHNVSGISVEMSKSSMNYVTLSPLNLDTTGRYRCEVSEEGPIFATDSEYGDMLVVVTPQEGPSVDGAQHRFVINFIIKYLSLICRYFLGDDLSINCSCRRTLPPANLTLYINQKLVSLKECSEQCRCDMKIFLIPRTDILLIQNPPLET